MFIGIFFVGTGKAKTNSPPIANSDSYTGVAARSQVAPGFLVNDFDPDPGDSVSIDIRFPIQAQNGDAFLTSFAGSFMYVPLNGWTGSDSFQYRICDRQEGDPERLCAIGTVTLINANSAPVAETDVYFGSSAGFGNTYDPTTAVLINDYDKEGDSFTVDTNYPSTPQHGWASFLQDGRFTYTVTDTGFTGLDSFNYKICDYLANSNPGACSIGKVYVFVGAIGEPAANFGDTCPMQSVGEPVNVTNGNMWLTQTDYQLPTSAGPGINLTRTTVKDKRADISAMRREFSALVGQPNMSNI